MKTLQKTGASAPRWPTRLLLLALTCLSLRADGNIATYDFAPLAGAPALLDHTDGTGASARFLLPNALAADAAGNVYVADTGDHTIRKVTPGGAVSTFAGTSGVAGSLDGDGASARFEYPAAIAVDGAGNLYVADMGDNSVRKITSGGSVTTLVRGDAGLNSPQGIAVDASGNVYVADTDSHLVRTITPGGGLSTLAGGNRVSGGGDGTGASARFNLPCGLAVDSAGNVFVADFGNSTIRRITPVGVVTTVAGKTGMEGDTNGTGAAARFRRPGGVTVDGAGTLYVVDTSNQTVRKIAPGGVVTTLAGGSGQLGRLDGAGAAARFAYPFSLAVGGGGAGVALYVADRGNHTVRRVTLDGAVTTLAGGSGQSGASDGGGTAARFYYPDGIAVDASGNVYVADRSNHTIRKVTSAGVATTLAGLAGVSGSANGSGPTARFNDPTGVAVDGAGNVYVADFGNHLIRKITPAGLVTNLAGKAGVAGGANGSGGSASFNGPQGVAVDTAGNVYVADTGNHVIRKVTPTGVTSVLAGAVGKAGAIDGTAGAARFSSPYAVAVDDAGNVYVSDYNNSTIRRVSAAGVVTTLAGLAGQEGGSDGVGAEARFFGVYGLAVDRAGNVLATDTFNHAVRQITPTGDVTTVTGGMARFYYPEGIAVDRAGVIYVADADNHSLSKGSPALQITARSEARVARVGEAVGFEVTVSGGSFSYQWFLDGDPIPGANGPSYAIASAVETDSGDYQVRVGSQMVDAGSLTVLASGAIGGEPYAVFTRGIPGSHLFLRSVPTTWKASGLPSWAKLNVLTGRLTATPTSKAKTTFVTVTATGGAKPYPTLRFALVVKAADTPDFALSAPAFSAAAPGRVLNGISFVNSGGFFAPAEPIASPRRAGAWTYDKTEPNAGVLTLQYGSDTFAGMDLVYADVFTGWAVNYDIVDGDPVAHAFKAFDLRTFLVPLGVAASDRTFNDKVRVTWTTETWAQGYRVYRYTTVASANAGKGVAISGKNAVVGGAYDDLKAAPGKTYYYRVAAVRQGVTGGQGLADPGTRFAQAAQKITFAAPTKMTHGDAPLLLLPGASSGLPVTLTVISGPATLDGHVLTVTGAGKVVIRATQAGDFAFTAATPVSRSITVAKAPVTPAP